MPKLQPFRPRGTCLRVVARDGEAPLPVATVVGCNIPGEVRTQHFVWFPVSPSHTHVGMLLRNVPSELTEQQERDKRRKPYFVFHHDEYGFYLLFFGTQNAPEIMCSFLQKMGFNIRLETLDIPFEEVQSCYIEPRMISPSIRRVA